MRYFQSLRVQAVIGYSLIGVFALLVGCAEPVHVGWSDRLSVIEPTLPPPEGRLDVYSERFVAWDGDVPRVTRRAAKVYTFDGQFVASAGDQDGEGPIHFSLTPGRYVVASEDRMQWRKLQVEVKDGRDTIVAESRWDAAPLLSSSDTDRPAQMAAH
jgi:hypothetical protein